MPCAPPHLKPFHPMRLRFFARHFNNMKKKYEINKDGCCVALRSFGDVTRGDFGGYVDSEKNLSQDGDCWVYDDAHVSGNARVYENALVYENAYVFGNAVVFGNAEVFGWADVFGNAQVFENAVVFGNAQVSGTAVVSWHAYVFGNTRLSGDAGDAPTPEAIPSDAAKILENLLDSPVESLTMDGITYKKTAAKWERA